MSSMPMIAPGPASAAASGASVAQGAGAVEGLEQLFAQLMAQIQAALEQSELDGASLPPEGEGLPPELLGELEAFAGQFGGELDDQQLAELSELIDQLDAEGVSEDQARQLLQAALLLQDAEADSSAELQPLGLLVAQIRSGDQRERLSVDEDGEARRSVDELLALAQQLRKQGEAVSSADAGGNDREGIVRSLVAESRAEEAAQQLAVDDSEDQALQNTAETTGREAGGVEVASEDRRASEPGPVTPVTSAEQQSAAALSQSQAGAAVQSERQPMAAASASVASSVASAVVGEAPRGAAAEAGRGVDADGAATVRAESRGAEVRAESDGSQQGDRRDGQREGQRDQGLARWAELRDSVVAQGQKLAQNDSAFKGVLMAQSVVRQGESISLAQVSGNASLSQLQQTYQSSQTSSMVLGLGERFGGDRWTPAASQRIVWMAGQNVGQAELRLDPPELGSLNVRLSLSGDQASLSFTSPHAHVREVLEQQMPRLREMLAESGIELGDADVSSQPHSDASGDADRGAAGSDSELEDAELASLAEESLARPQMALSLVDYYA